MSQTLNGTSTAEQARPAFPQLGMRELFGAVTSRLLDEDLSLAVVLADISAGYFEDAALRHPDRVLNVGIREQLAVNVGAGLALTGMRPLVHTIAPFLVERAFEQIKLGFNHQGVGGVLVSNGASYDNSVSGRTHQSPGDVTLIDSLPGWEVLVPGHPGEVEPLLRRAVDGDGLVYLRISTQTNRSPRPVTPGFGVVRVGTRGTVVAVGPMLEPTLAAVGDLDVTVLYASRIRPFDAVGLRSTLGQPDVVLVEPYAEGTSAHEVARALADLPHRVLSVGVPRVEFRHYGHPKEHAAAHGLDAAGIRRRVRDFLDSRPR